MSSAPTHTRLIGLGEPQSVLRPVLLLIVSSTHRLHPRQTLEGLECLWKCTYCSVAQRRAHRTVMTLLTCSRLHVALHLHCHPSFDRMFDFMRILSKLQVISSLLLPSSASICWSRNFSLDSPWVDFAALSSLVGVAAGAEVITFRHEGKKEPHAQRTNGSKRTLER
ncbi:hypothetical protein BU25DRAFT_129484 [Macroventuria anomochaeta]|uniref:Uncharacterized protein n=1 Tax=Macroventuria anomochaeta TaxID=301207 RepID=A0ACB6RSL6_9PLEO|nr:uncharacterized protein BU25DRAFT_129484 [Macroventuria anomochaeta]KAF2624960.1 hypothetical protein BU25DRAFT_129484 [Macroventuria anomochaeta]